MAASSREIKSQVLNSSNTPFTHYPKFGTGVMSNGIPFETLVIPAKAGIHTSTMALQLSSSPSGPELLDSNESTLPLDSRFRGKDFTLERARLADGMPSEARMKNHLPRMTPVPGRRVS